MFLAGFFHIAAVLAAVYILLELYGDGRVPAPVTPRGVAASICGLIAFLFLPSGGLPPLLDYPWGAGVFFVLLAAGSIFARRGVGVPVSLGVLYAVFGICAWYAYQRGVPGNPLNFGTYVAMPLWQYATGLSLTATILLAVTAFLNLRCILPPEGRIGIVPRTIIYMAASSMWVTLFLPWNFVAVVNWPEVLSVGIDSIVFWIKVMVVSVLAGKIPRPRRFSLVISACLCGIAAILCVIELS